MIALWLPYLCCAGLALLVLLGGMALGYRLGKARTQTSLVIPGSRDIIIEVTSARIKSRENR